MSLQVYKYSPIFIIDVDPIATLPLSRIQDLVLEIHIHIPSVLFMHYPSSILKLWSMQEKIKYFKIHFWVLASYSFMFSLVMIYAIR